MLFDYYVLDRVSYVNENETQRYQREGFHKTQSLTIVVSFKVDVEFADQESTDHQKANS